MSLTPHNLVTQFGYLKLINLGDFIENIIIEPLVCDDFRYIRCINTGFAFFDDNYNEPTEDFLKVEDLPQKFVNIRQLKISVEEDIRKNISKKGEVSDLGDVLVDFAQHYGEATHLVLLPNKQVMPANMDDFRIKIFGNKYLFCWFNSNRFFSYKFDLDKYLKEIGA